ncbi:DNA-3-methyladenine glycosylase family protein [Terricaulis silvestris]|uniref:DNA-3-methyladenine glycosylase II n=1 Tax=Terricaulis silvestris TaxID=2686094 RepID=A0A6I6MIV0_9CAUL|nr:DNA-3-methyladenine glycosylase [Terricaulis silvestris]QGZ94509.1 DNA-3-methyladenine glycosylase 2 [Terricaulis silvestris]
MGDAEEHLSTICKRFAGVVAKHEPFPTKFERQNDPYRALIRAVVFQQLSGKAAQTIHGRVLALFADKDHPEPSDILSVSDELLRGAGLSRQKIAALRDISQKRLDGIIPEARALSKLGDEEIIERLTAARGVGRWTVEMYLMFTLGRPDILPVDDLGVRKGAEKLYSRGFTPKELAAYGERWTPYRSAAAWHLWRIADTLTPDRSPTKKAKKKATKKPAKKVAKKKLPKKKAAKKAKRRA